MGEVRRLAATLSEQLEVAFRAFGVALIRVGAAWADLHVTWDERPDSGRQGQRDG